MAFFLVGCIIVSSCSDDEVITQQPIVRDTQTDMQVLSRYIDINESTNEYYINENKKTRALSYVTGADWKELEKVSSINLEKCKRNLRDLNTQVAMAIGDPNITYIVFSVEGKTLVKKIRDAYFDLVSSKTKNRITLHKYDQLFDNGIYFYGVWPLQPELSIQIKYKREHKKYRYV